MTTAPERRPCQLRINGGARTIETRTGLTVYAACRSNKLFIPTGCGAQGKCALCGIDAIGDLTAPTDVEKQKLDAHALGGGRRLACQARLDGPNVEVTVPDYALAAKEYVATVERIEPLTHDIRGVSLRLADGDRVDFRAGQFMAFSSKPCPGQRIAGTRAYSLASSPSEHGRIDLIIRRVTGGQVTSWVFEHMKEGETVTLTGPFGEFHLRDTGRPAVMIGGGSGLSPFLSMMQDLAERKATRPVKLYFGAVNLRDLYYVDHFRAFAAKNPWFTFIPALSGDESGHDYERGLITEVVERTAGDLSGAEAYICGSPGMVCACEKSLAKLHLPADRLYYDRFA